MNNLVWLGPERQVVVGRYCFPATIEEYRFTPHDLERVVVDYPNYVMNSYRKGIEPLPLGELMDIVCELASCTQKNITGSGKDILEGYKRWNRGLPEMIEDLLNKEKESRNVQ